MISICTAQGAVVLVKITKIPGKPRIKIDSEIAAALKWPPRCPPLFRPMVFSFYRMIYAVYSTEENELSPRIPLTVLYEAREADRLICLSALWGLCGKLFYPFRFDFPATSDINPMNTLTA